MDNFFSNSSQAVEFGSFRKAPGSSAPQIKLCKSVQRQHSTGVVVVCRLRDNASGVPVICCRRIRRWNLLAPGTFQKEILTVRTPIETEELNSKNSESNALQPYLCWTGLWGSHTWFVGNQQVSEYSRTGDDLSPNAESTTSMYAILNNFYMYTLFRHF